MSNEMIVRNTEIIATEINAIKEQARAMLVSSAIEIGKRLAEAKELVPFGQWGKWLEDNVSYSERTAQNLMRCWEEYGKKQFPQAITDLSLTKAVALLGATPEQRRELVESGEAEEMSVRELQKRISEMQAEMDARQVRIDELLFGAQEAERTRGEALEAMSKAMEAQQAAEDIKGHTEEAERKAAELAEELAKARKALEDEKAKEKPSAKQQREIEETKAALAREHDRAEAAIRRAVEAENRVPEKETVTVEKVPEEVQEELDRLRERVKKAPNAEVIKIRDSYARALKEFETLRGLLDGLGDEAAAYRQAMAAGLRKMADMIGG